jgi:hypothetical protein
MINKHTNKELHTMNFEKSFGYIDTKKTAQWFEHEEGGKFLIAPLGNPKQVEENLKIISSTATEVEQTLYEAKMQSCTILSRSVLLDWDEVTNEDGTKRLYTPEAGLEVLYHFDEFRDWVIKKSTELVQSKEERKGKIVKN